MLASKLVLVKRSVPDGPIGPPDAGASESIIIKPWVLDRAVRITIRFSGGTDQACSRQAELGKLKRPFMLHHSLPGIHIFEHG